MDRRSLLRRSITSAAALSFGPGFWQRALASPAAPGPSPYGPLGEPDANGIRLPEGFTSRIVAVSTEPVGVTHQSTIPYVWPPFPDGAATYETGDMGWVVAVNSEVPRADALRVALGVPAQYEAGGCSSLVFDADGNVVDAYSILEGTDGNCAGGKTPWHTWLSCEEPQVEPNSPTEGYARGAVWECDPFGENPAVELPAMGLFKHEGAVIDPVNEHAFMTEDEPDGTFYRFVPDAYPDLSAGTLQVPKVAEDGSVTWHDVPDPSAAEVRTVEQVEGTTRFDGGEGIWYDLGYVYFTTKNDHRVWVHDIANQTIFVLYDADDYEDPPLAPAEPGNTSVDNLVVSSSGDLFVAEDGGDLEIVMITADTRNVAAVVQVTGDQHQGSEICGPCFSPDGSRLYFSSQRGRRAQVGTGDPSGEAPVFGNGFGITYEVTGPWRTERVGIAAVGDGDEPSPMPGPQPAPDGGRPSEQPAGPSTPATGGGAAIGLGAIVAAAALRRRSAVLQQGKTDDTRD